MTSAVNFLRRGLLLVLPGLLLACSPSPETRSIEGATMGTLYHITWLDGSQPLSAEVVQSGIESVLDLVNESMSTYRDDSEISEFNRLPVGQWHTPSAGFQHVFSLARDVSEASNGAYDVSVGPLVDLWGFGSSRRSSVPADTDIAAARDLVGQQYVEVGDGGTMRKLRELHLDFSSIAKGYAVDEVAGWMRAQGITRYLVEVGGEIRVGGQSPRGDPWRIAVEQPQPMYREVARVLELDDRAVATSGDYRNYFEVDGVRYSHVIDPRTGRPVRHQLVSVTVVHTEASLADAWATALTTLGRDKALAIASQQGLAVYLISRDGDDFRIDKTPEIDAYLR